MTLRWAAGRSTIRRGRAAWHRGDERSGAHTTHDDIEVEPHGRGGRRRIQHRDRGSLHAEPRPAQRRGDGVQRGVPRRRRSPSSSTPRSGTASTRRRSAEFDAAVAHNELVAPPAGAIGRGDAFVLSIANKVGARILSNDSFQEFHGDYPWLFDEGRLIGGKPVPYVGWVFVERLPVKGPVSRKSQRRRRAASRGEPKPVRRSASREASLPMPVPTAPPPGRRAAGPPSQRPSSRSLAQAAAAGRPPTDRARRSTTCCRSSTSSSTTRSAAASTASSSRTRRTAPT